MVVDRRQPDIAAEVDSGPRMRGLERLCVATRTVRPIADLIRFVVGPDGETVPDLRRKLPGRGVWVTATQAALSEAVKRKAFARGFKRDVQAPADLVMRTERLLERAVLDALAIVGKAGLAVVGFSRIEAALQHDPVVVLIHAADASSEGIRKLAAALHRRSGRDPVTVIGTLTGAQLDLALGRPNVVHAALLAGPATDTFVTRYRRLERFRTGEPTDKAPAVGNPAPNRGGRDSVRVEMDAND